VRHPGAVRLSLALGVAALALAGAVSAQVPRPGTAAPEVTAAGRPLGPLGGEGQARRNVPLVPDRLVALVSNPND